MTTRKERTVQFTTEIENQWSYYWFNNVILKHLKAEHLSDNLKNKFIWIEITRNPNTTTEIVESYINLPWNWNIICYSLIKSIDFVLRNYQSVPIDWSALSMNMNISLDDIENNLHLPWVWKTISCRDDLTPEFVVRHQDKDWDIRALSERANLWEDINKNAQNYCVHSAVYNPKITVEFIERHMELYTKEGVEWYLTRILQMNMIGLDFIERHIELLISVKQSHLISHNPNVTVEFIIKHPEIWWDMRVISEYNPNITPEIVVANPELKWDWDMLIIRPNFSPSDYRDPEFELFWRRYSSSNPAFDFRYVPDKKLSSLNWEYLSQSNHIQTVEAIEKYKKYINWRKLSASQFITMKFVKDHPEYPWDCEGLLMNTNCSLETYETHKYLVPTHLQLKIFEKSLKTEKDAFIDPKIREYLAAYRIQQCWIRARTDPNYALCRKKLEADWDFACKTLLT